MVYKKGRCKPILIKVRNLLDLNAPISYLTSSVAAGGTTLPIQNINQYTGNWAIQLGKSGEEKAEILLLSSNVTGTALNTTGTTRFDHQTDTPVYAIKYDQLVFERSTVGTAGTATPMSSGTISISPDSQYTFFDDTSGSTTYAYKTYFRASILAVNSTESDWLTSAGFTFYSKAKLRQRIRGKLYDSTYIQQDSDIDDWLNEWLEIMTNAAIDVNKDYSLGTTNVSYSGTAQLGTISSTDYKDVRRVWLTYDGGNSWAKATKKDINGFEPTEVFNQQHPYYYFQGDNVIGRLPSDVSGSAGIIYYKTTPILVEDTDELPVVMHNYTKSFVDYGEAQARKKDGKLDESTALENNAKLALQKFVSQITPRSQTGAVYVDQVEPSDGQDALLI